MVSGLSDLPPRVPSVSVWAQTAQCSSSGNGLELRGNRREEGTTGSKISGFHCPGTELLNQPLVVDKMIWIQSQQDPLPPAACRHRRCRSWSLSSVELDLMEGRGKKTSSFPYFFYCLVLPFLLLLPCESSSWGAIFRATGSMCESKFEFLLRSDACSRHNRKPWSFFLTCKTVSLKLEVWWQRQALWRPACF